MDYDEKMEAAEQRLIREFICAALTKTAEDDVDFHTTTDWSDGFGRYSRPAKVWEMMLETLEGNGNVASYLMQSLMLCAKKGDQEAQSAIRKMAVEFAKHNAFVEE